MTALLDIRGLGVSYRRPRKAPLQVLRGVDLQVHAGQVVGIIGESASGKSTLAQTVMRLFGAEDADITGAGVFWKGRNLLELAEDDLATLRGREIAMIFQDPMTSLDPIIPVGEQIVEVIRSHRDLRRTDARKEVAALLQRVGLGPAMAARRPFELSGGQRQRAMIAMAVANRPQLIIADEPTTALDVTLQAEILELLKELARETGAAVLLITHDLGVVARMADHVYVMYAGEIVESAPIDQLFGESRMPYSWGLLQSAPRPIDMPPAIRQAIPGSPPSLENPPPGCRFHPRCGVAQDICRFDRPELKRIAPGHESRCHFADKPGWRAPYLDTARAQRRPANDDALLDLQGIRKIYGAGPKAVAAIEHVDLTLRRGETLAVVGESGCGKSTLARIIVQLVEPTAGSIRLNGKDVDPADRKALRDYRRRVQMVFQDPYSSLNPRMRILEAVAEPCQLAGRSRREARARAAALLERCGLMAQVQNAFPHQLSGGQRQRVGLARALSLDPEIIVLDEPVSALDVSIQAQVLDLLREIQAELNTTFLFISHDLSVVRQLADRVAVMQAGRIVELGVTEDVFRHPQHQYTAQLLAAIPTVDGMETHDGNGNPPAARHHSGKGLA